MSATIDRYRLTKLADAMSIRAALCGALAGASAGMMSNTDEITTDDFNPVKLAEKSRRKRIIKSAIYAAICGAGSYGVSELIRNVAK